MLRKDKNKLKKGIKIFGSNSESFYFCTRFERKTWSQVLKGNAQREGAKQECEAIFLRLKGGRKKNPKKLHKQFCRLKKNI